MVIQTNIPAKNNLLNESTKNNLLYLNPDSPPRKSPNPDKNIKYADPDNILFKTKKGIRQYLSSINKPNDKSPLTILTKSMELYQNAIKQLNDKGLSDLSKYFEKWYRVELWVTLLKAGHSTAITNATLQILLQTDSKSKMMGYLKPIIDLLQKATAYDDNSLESTTRVSELTESAQKYQEAYNHLVQTNDVNNSKAAHMIAKWYKTRLSTITFKHGDLVLASAASNILTTIFGNSPRSNSPTRPTVQIVPPKTFTPSTPITPAKPITPIVPVTPGTPLTPRISPSSTSNKIPKSPNSTTKISKALNLKEEVLLSTKEEGPENYPDPNKPFTKNNNFSRKASLEQKRKIQELDASEQTESIAYSQKTVPVPSTSKSNKKKIRFIDQTHGMKIEDWSHHFHY
jgi:hypothetical protein